MNKLRKGTSLATLDDIETTSIGNEPKAQPEDRRDQLSLLPSVTAGA